MCINKSKAAGTVKIQRENVIEVLKYLGSTIQSNGQYTKEVQKGTAEWNG